PTASALASGWRQYAGHPPGFAPNGSGPGDRMTSLPETPLPETVDGLLTYGAARWPGRPALADRRQALSYAELDVLVARAANGLLALGLEAGARIAVYLGKDVEAVAAMFGA